MKIGKSILLILFVALIGYPSLTLSAESQDVPEIMRNAFEKYQKEGTDQLIPALLKGSPLEGDKTALSQVNSLRQIETFYGRYLDYEIVESLALSKSTQLLYYVLNYEKGPLFGKATVYKANGKEMVTNFNFHTEIHQIIPAELIFNKK